MSLKFLPFAVTISLAIIGTGAAQAQVNHFHFHIDPETPLKNLLPAAPKTECAPGALAIEDLDQVPEVHFQDLRAVFVVREQIAHQIAKINFLNQKKTDHFMEVLLKNRPDLAGLPFVLGEACRLKKAERDKFAPAVLNVRESLKLLPTRNGFWQKHVKVPEDRFAVAALTQILATESSWSPGFIEHLAKCDKKEATQALARLAIFPGEEWIRRLARDVLQKRDTGPATDILLQGLRYPWPAVAKNTAEAVVQLQRTDLAPELAKMLEEPDPRAPRLREINGKPVAVVRELVRINHLRNCLLCHPPANTPDVAQHGLGALTREVPDPTQPLPLYVDSREMHPDLSVRADVTYLRQDFSLLQKVDNVDRWPAMQRFDFLVRNRVLTDEEAQSYQAEFAGSEETSPYRQAALTALRRLTGQDAASTGWAIALSIALGGTSLFLLPCCLIYWFRRWRARQRSSPVAGLPL